MRDAGDRDQNLLGIITKFAENALEMIFPRYLFRMSHKARLQLSIDRERQFNYDEKRP